jgi:hypothetical protein
LCLVRFNHFWNALAAREGLPRADCWGRLYEYADQTGVIFVGKQTGELQNARRFSSVVGEDHNLAEFGSVLVRGPWDRFSHRRPC